MPSILEQMTPEELNALQYHRNNLNLGAFLQHPTGEKTTFMGAIVEAPGGKQMLIPTYWGGAIRPVPDAMRMAIKSGIKFPTYDTVEEAEAREKYIHSLMEQDVKKYDAEKAK